MKKSTRVLFLIITIVFVVFGAIVFSGNGHLISKKLKTNEYMQDRISTGVYGSIFSNRDLGFFSYQGLQTTFERPGTHKAHSERSFLDKSYVLKEMYLEGVIFAKEDLTDVYASKVNLGGVFFSMLDKGLSVFGLSQVVKSSIFHALSLTSFLLLIILIAIWAVKELGILSSVFIYTATVLSYWLIPFGSGLSNSLFVYFLPFTISLMILYRENKRKVKTNASIEFLLIAGAVALKAMMGYECLPTILISALIPYFYYAIVYQWGLKEFLGRLIKVGLFALGGLVITLIVHSIQLSIFYGDIAAGVGRLLKSFDKRTYGIIYEFSDAHIRAQKSTMFVVFREYYYAIKQSYIVSISLKGLIIGTSSIVSLFVISRLVADKSSFDEKLNKKLLAMLACIGLAFAGALATLIIFKAHSRIHISFSMVVFYIPLSIFIFGLIGYVVKESVTSLSKGIKLKKI